MPNDYTRNICQSCLYEPPCQICDNNDMFEPGEENKSHGNTRPLSYKVKTSLNTTHRQYKSVRSALG